MQSTHIEGDWLSVFLSGCLSIDFNVECAGHRVHYGVLLTFWDYVSEELDQ